MTEKTALPRSQPPTDLFSYEGPPQGDYVRYVDRLMAWAEQEQARTNAALVLPQVEAAHNAQEELLRRVAELQQRAAAGKRKPVDEPAPISKPRTTTITTTKPKGATNIAWMVFFVALLILAPGFAPLVIVLWVLWKVRSWWRSVAAKA